MSGRLRLATAPGPAAAEHELIMLRSRIHAAIAGDCALVARFLAAWARHIKEPSPMADRVMMRCPFPGHEDPGASCVVFMVADDPAVRFACRGCGSSGDVVAAHQLIFGSDVRQAMCAVWALLAGSLWQDDLNASPRPVDMPRHLATIIDAVSTVCGVSAEQITGYGKARWCAEARWLAMFVARAETDLSSPELGRAFGGRDHTTVLYGVRRAKQLLEERNDLREKLQAIEAWVQQPQAMQEVQQR